jgi:hypothetical protein
MGAKLLLRVAAILAGVAWVWLCWPGFTGPESLAARDWRTSAFVAAFVCASFGWTPRTPKRGGRNREGL